MTGMFQSSKTASGIERLQASSAFSPSSASMIWKSRPSRIRRATLRMTLESSTIRHVLMTASHFLIPNGDISIPTMRARWRPACYAALLRGLGIRCQFEHAIDVEDDHELPVEPMDTAGELGH